MKKTISLIITAAVIASVGSGCSSKSLSNPVATDAEGNVDTTASLSYQTDIDALIAELDAKEVNPDDTVSENSGASTNEVFKWLRENYGKKLITAQETNLGSNYELYLYFNETGDLPAILGYDMIFTTQNNPDYSQTDEAIEWGQKSGGIVTFTWHWNVPRDIDNLSKGTAFYQDEILNFSFENAVTPGTKEYERVVQDIDTVAIQLQRLEEAGVTVLWRPLHEASGSWFWWGKQTGETVKAQCYQKLWYLVYDRLENYHKLTNLIWVWNGQSTAMTVSPNTYDIAGIDIYPTTVDHSSQIRGYQTLSGMTADGKMMALSECGYMPDIEKIKESGAFWLYFMPWSGDFIYQTTGFGSPMLNLDSMPSVNTEKYSAEFLKTLYASEDVITWSELPTFSGTTHALPELLRSAFPQAFK